MLHFWQILLNKMDTTEITFIILMHWHSLERTSKCEITAPDLKISKDRETIIIMLSNTTGSHRLCL